jgi:phosphohistidine phosphatase
MGLRHLYLLRHAKAEEARAGQEDLDRPLAPEGGIQAQKLAAYLTEKLVDSVLCSPAVRTQATMRRAMGKKKATVAMSDRLFQGSAQTLLYAIHDVDDTATGLMVVAHNPGIHTLAMQLANDETPFTGGMPPATLASFTFEGSWRNVLPRSCRLEAVFRP